MSQKAVEVGNRIRAQRDRMEWTQPELGVRIGVTGNAVAQYETGRTMPRPERLQLIAELTDTTVEWLLTGGDEAELARAQTNSELAMLREFRSLPLEQQAIAFAAVQGIAASNRKK